MTLESILHENARRAKVEQRRVEALRDGTEIGELKADYLEAVYRRRSRLGAIRILKSAGVRSDYEEFAELADEIRECVAIMDHCEARLDELGVRVRKVRGDALRG